MKVFKACAASPNLVEALTEELGKDVASFLQAEIFGVWDFPIWPPL